MRYVGNTALSPQIQERIQNTFRQTLGLAEEGNRQEALLGCDFILRLDPLFEPARRLQERLNDGDGPVDTLGLVDSADTEPQTSETVSQPETQVEPPMLEPQEAPIPEGSVDIGELIADGPDEPPLVNDEPVPATPIELTTEDDPAIATTPADEMSLEVEPPVEAVELTTEAEPTIAATPADEMSLEVEPPAHAVAMAEGTGIDDAELVLGPEDTPPVVDEEPVVAGLSTRLAMLLEQRNFQELMGLAVDHQDEINADPELERLIGLATERMEAEPYVRNFLESAQRAREKGDLEAARGHMEKARELDASHPDLPGLEADIEAADRVEPPASFEPPPPEVPPLDVPPLEDPVLDAPVLEETPPLVDTSAAPEEDIFGGEVDEFFDSVETAGEEAAPAVAAVDEAEPAQAPAPDQPQIVPSLDAEPAARLDSESEQRIHDLLHEGQASFEDGQYQTAIDAWSRIFLIDIDHAEASRRIELARKLKAEVERQTEEAFHDGITRLETGDEEKAKAAFHKVLEMQPNHMGARDYLDKIEAGDFTASGAEVPELAPVIDTPTAPEPAVDEPLAEFAEPALDAYPGPSEIDDLSMPEPVLEPTPPPAPRKRSFILIGTAVLILLLGVGGFLYSNWDRFFPASGPDETAAVPVMDPIERARELHEAGNTAMAINVLRRLAPGQEKYAEAQALIAAWEVSTPPEEPRDEQPSAEVLARREQLLSQAGQALNSGQHLLAMDLLDQAETILELDEEHMALRDQATVALEYLREERDLFDQGDWEFALPNLWRMHDNNPENPDVVRLMIDSYYNLGVRDLQRGDAESALEKFEEAQTLTEQSDADLDRLAQFAAAYSQRSADMLYRIFVKYQRFR